MLLAAVRAGKAAVLGPAALLARTMSFVPPAKRHPHALPACPGGGRGPPAGAPLLYPSLSCAACCCAGRTLRIFEFPSCSSRKWCFVFFRIRTAALCLVRRRQHCRLIILADTSGEVCVGLAGRLDAVFCAASYDGPVTWKVHVKRRDVDLPRP